MSVNRLDATPLRISNNASTTRQTPKTSFGDVMHRGLVDHEKNVLQTKGLSTKGAEEVVNDQEPSDPVDQTVMRGLQVSFVPGAAVVSAAVSGGCPKRTTGSNDAAQG